MRSPRVLTLAALAAAAALLAISGGPARGRAAPADAPGTVETIAGGGTSLDDGIPATDASIGLVQGMTVAPNGDLYISDFGSRCVVQKIHDGAISTVAGSGVCGYSTNSGVPATAAEIYRPAGLALDTAGDLYFADMANCTIDRVDATTQIFTIVAGGGHSTCSAADDGDGGPATSASIVWPLGVAVAPNGDLYIAESERCRVRKISGGIITTIAGEGSSGCSVADTGDGGPATSADLSLAIDVVLGGDGSVYVSTRCAIRRIDLNGIITTVVGTGACGPVGIDGPAATTPLGEVDAFTMDAAGDIFIAEFNTDVAEGDPGSSCLIREVRNGKLSTISGALGTPTTSGCGFAGDGMQASAAQFAEASAFALDAAGNLYVADAYNLRLRVIYGAASTADTDADGCGDGAELALSPPLDPTDPWDFYSVPVPALFASPDPTHDVRGTTISASNAQAVFAYFRQGAVSGTTVYDQDLDGNGVEDGVQYDRTVAAAGISGPPDGVIAASDAELAFAQFRRGYAC